MSQLNTAILSEVTTQQTAASEIDHVEIYVGNAVQASHFYATALGFTPIGFAGPSTGRPDRISFLMLGGDIRLILTSPVTSEGAISRHVLTHGDSVSDLGLRVRDASAAFEHAMQSGAHAVMAPTVVEDDSASIVKATVAGLGDLTHSFIEHRGNSVLPLPGFQRISPALPVAPTNITAVDHIAISVEGGQLERVAKFYETVFGFKEAQAEIVSTEYSGMNSRVVQSGSGGIKFPLVEPVEGVRKSPIQEYLTFHNGPGVHHLAFSSPDILDTVRVLRNSGVSFMRTPRAYYDMLPARVGSIEESIVELAELGILVDREGEGYLLQVFTTPLQPRPTFSLEIIQRKKAHGFGSGNVRALFEAIEREQLLRGNA
jgi:4-hydroxyphenylpyruvate dioxygenase